MTLKMKKADFEAMVVHSRAELPFEACGLIAGNVGGGVAVVEKVYLLSNPDMSSEHYSIDPKEQLAATKDMRANGYAPLGNFHSHPSTPARPSDEDIRLAYDPKAFYLIISLSDETPELGAYEIVDGNVAKLKLEII